jgi:WD40 repeat protein
MDQGQDERSRELNVGDAPLVDDENSMNNKELVSDDEGPAFIDTEEAVEVDVDLDNEPMSDDDDEDMQQDDSGFLKVVVEEEEMIVSNNDDMATCVLSNSHTGPVYSCASILHYSADNGGNCTVVIASGGGDDKALIHTVVLSSSFNAATTISSNSIELIELIPPDHKNTDTITCVAFSSTTLPTVLAAGCYDGTVQLWDVNVQQDGSVKAVYIRQLDGPSDIEWISWHPNGGTVLLAGSTDGTVWMWFTPTGKCLQVFVGHSSDDDGSTAGSFTPDGKWAVTCGVDGTLRIWAPKKGLCKHTFGGTLNTSSKLSGSPITCMSMIQNSPDDSLAAVGCEDGTAWIVHLTNKKVIGCLHHHISTNSSSNQQQRTMQYDNDDDDDTTVDVEPRSVEAVAFAPQSLNVKWFATAGVDGVLKIWDTANNACRQTCVHMSSPGSVAAGVTRLLWHPVFPFIYTSASDGVIRLWDTRSGVCLKSLTGHSDVINDMCILFGDGGNKPDIVITGSDDYSVRVFIVDGSEYATTATNTMSASHVIGMS